MIIVTIIEKIGYLALIMNFEKHILIKSRESNTSLAKSPPPSTKCLGHRVKSMTFYIMQIWLSSLLSQLSRLIQLIVYFRGWDFLLDPCVKMYLITIFLTYGLSSCGYWSCFISLNSHTNEICSDIFICLILKHLIFSSWRGMQNIDKKCITQ